MNNDANNALAGTASGAAAGSSGGWIGSAIGAAIGLGTALLSNAQAKKNRQANERLAEKQFEQNMQLWTLQNQYNTPSMQAARLKTAGLNPALAYGGNGALVGNADAAPNLDYAGAMSTPAFNFDSSIQAGLSARQLVSQLELNSSAVDSNKATANKNNIEAVRTSELYPEEKKAIQQNILLDEAKTSQTYVAIEEAQSNINLRASQIALNDVQKRGLEIANEIADASKDYQIESYRLHNEKEGASIREINKKMSVYNAEINELKSRIAVNMSQARLNDSSKYKNEYEYDQIAAYTELLGKESQQMDELIRKAAAEANISEKDVKWYVYDKISDTVLDVAKIGISAYSGIGFVGAATTNAAAGTMRSKAYAMDRKIDNGYAPAGPYK